MEIKALLRLRHVQPHSDIIGIIHAHSESYVTLGYSEPWHIQNQSHVKNPSMFRTLVYSGHWHIENPDIFRTNGTFHENLHYIQIVIITAFAKLVAIISN